MMTRTACLHDPTHRLPYLPSVHLANVQTSLTVIEWLMVLSAVLRSKNAAEFASLVTVERSSHRVPSSNRGLVAAARHASLEYWRAETTICDQATTRRMCEVAADMPEALLAHASALFEVEGLVAYIDHDTPEAFAAATLDHIHREIRFLAK